MIDGRSAGFALRALTALIVATAARAEAQTAIDVTLHGTFGTRAVISVDGDAPHTLAVGGSVQGVKLLSVGSDSAVVDVQGQRRTISFGHNTVAFSAAAGAATPPRVATVETDASTSGHGHAVLQADPRGHFTAQGQINGVSAAMMVDTGASIVVIPAGDAARFGIDYRSSPRVGAANTANGVVRVWYVKLDSVRVQGIVAYNVEAAVEEAPLATILLGNSFLGRVQLQRDGDSMVLQQRY